MDRLSGLTNPCPTAVHMETFSSSVFKNSHLKNCHYHQDLRRKFLHPCSRVGRTATIMPSSSKFYRDCNNAWASMARFCAIHFQGLSFWQISSYTLPSRPADFNFHDHRSADNMNQHLLQCHVSEHSSTLPNARFTPHHQFCLPKMAHVELLFIPLRHVRNAVELTH